MIRIVIENIALFFLPTAVYVLIMVLAKRSSKAALIEGAPWFSLILAGTAMIIVVLVATGSQSGGKPGQQYQPAQIKDGRIVPGSIR